MINHLRGGIRGLHSKANRNGERSLQCEGRRNYSMIKTPKICNLGQVQSKFKRESCASRGQLLLKVSVVATAKAAELLKHTHTQDDLLCMAAHAHNNDGSPGMTRGTVIVICMSSVLM